MKYLYFFLFTFLTFTVGFSQDFNWTSDFNDNDQLDTCNASLVLNNNDGNLSNQEKVLTICPDDVEEVITLEFTSFSLNTTFSTLEIYNGNSTNAPLLFEYVSDALPPNPSYIASNATGCITLKFSTEFIPAIINIGFGAQFVCGDPCPDIFPEVSIDGITTCESSDETEYFRAGELLTFSGSALTSNNLPANELNFEWEIDGNDYTGENVQLSFTELGEVDATLTVTEPQGCQESINFDFEIRNDTINVNEVDDEYTLEELVSEVFIAGDCAIVDNINSPNNLNIYDSSNQSIGYFSKNCSDFPFENGIVIGSGNIEGVTTQSGTSAQNWPGEDELATLATGNQGSGVSNNATVIEFEFSSYEDEISFNYIFASNEYGGTNSFVCNFADTFAFILSGPGIDNSNLYNNDANPNTPAIDLDLGGLNIATLDDGSGNGLIPTTPTNIHPNPSCPAGSLGEFAISSLYNQNDPPYHILGGETQVLTATANVIPCEVYTMKIMVADYGDSAFDSYVFLEGGSFNLGANLGDDIFFTDAEPLFEGDVFTAEAFEGSLEGACDFNIEWYKDGELIEGETELTLDITETGNYEIFIISEEDSTLANCNSSDSIYVEFIPVPNPDNINEIQDLLICLPPVNEFDINLRTNDSFVLGTQNPNNFNVDYFLTEADANAGTNAIENPENFGINATELQSENLTVWIRVEEALTGNAQTFVTSSFEIGIADPNLNFVIPTLNACEAEDTSLATFNLTEVENTVYQFNDASGYSVTYFQTEADAEANLNPITNPSAFISTSTPFWIRLSSSFDQSCFTTKEVNAEIYPQPEINQLVDLSSCGDFTGSQTFDLTSITPTSVNTPNPGITSINFFYNESDAEANLNPITNNLDNYVIPNGITSQNIFVRLTNNEDNGGCFVIDSFNLSINNVEIPNEINDLFFCSDDTAVENGFNLTSQNTSIFGANQSDLNYSINYFTNLSDAELNTNPILNSNNYNLPSGINTQEIFVRISNNDAPECFETSSFMVGQYISPEINSLEDVSLCGDFSNSQTFDLTINNINSINTPNTDIAQVTYHNSIVDADNGVNPISNLTNYALQSANTEETIYIRVTNNENNGGCYVIDSFNLSINNVEIANEVNDLVECSDAVSELSIFDLTQQTPLVLGNNAVESFAISYHLNENDANTNVSAIQNLTAYQSVSQNQEIWVRIENLNDTGCFETASFELISQELADVNLNVDDINVCDNTNNTGFYNDFDFNVLIPQINNQSLSDVNITFHETLVDAESGTNALMSPYTNTQAFNQVIYVRVENGFQPVICSQITSFNLNINTIPDLTTPTEPLLDCDEDADELGIFDLTSFENILFENLNANDFSVAYYETEADASAGTNPIENIQSYSAGLGLTSIFIAVDNGDCSTIITAEVNVNPGDVSCEGIGTDAFSQQIEVYPNPVRTILNIDYSAVTPVEHIEVYNINGKRLASYKYNSYKSKIELNLSEYPAGIYLIKISNESETSIKKVLKQ